MVLLQEMLKSYSENTQTKNNCGDSANDGYGHVTQDENTI